MRGLPLRPLSFSNKAVWFVLAGGVLVLVAAVAGVVLYLRPMGATPTLSKQGGILIPDQTTFRANDVNRQVLMWLAKRWGTDEHQIYVIVQDSEPWMKIIGLLDLQSLASGRVWIIDTSHQEGQRWPGELERQGVPHEGNIYLISEYRPAQTDDAIATKFYSTKTLGGLAIIEDIRWTDVSRRTGWIIAYYSQRYLPSITVPIEDGVPLKGQAHQTPLLHD